MEKTYYIIRAHLNGGFWTGRSWSDEYPDAQLFTNKKAAVLEAMRTTGADTVDVIADYGLTTERCVMGVNR